MRGRPRGAIHVVLLYRISYTYREPNHAGSVYEIRRGIDGALTTSPAPARVWGSVCRLSLPLLGFLPLARSIDGRFTHLECGRNLLDSLVGCHDSEILRGAFQGKRTPPLAAPRFGRSKPGHRTLTNQVRLKFCQHAQDLKHHFAGGGIRIEPPIHIKLTLSSWPCGLQ